jgi:hypothetical protein
VLLAIPIALNTVLHSLIPAGTVVTTANSITDSGRFLVAVDSTGSGAFYLVTPVNPTQVALKSGSSAAGTQPFSTTSHVSQLYGNRCPGCRSRADFESTGIWQPFLILH